MSTMTQAEIEADYRDRINAMSDEVRALTEQRRDLNDQINRLSLEAYNLLREFDRVCPDRIKRYYCPKCGVECKKCHKCGFTYGRRGWRQTDVYDG